MQRSLAHSQRPQILPVLGSGGQTAFRQLAFVLRSPHGTRGGGGRREGWVMLLTSHCRYRADQPQC